MTSNTVHRLAPPEGVLQGLSEADKQNDLHPQRGHLQMCRLFCQNIAFLIDLPGHQGTQLPPPRLTLESIP